MSDCHTLPRYDTSACCSACHWSEFWQDDVTILVAFKDGRTLDLCGPAAAFAALAGLADPSEVEPFVCANYDRPLLRVL